MLVKVQEKLNDLLDEWAESIPVYSGSGGSWIEPVMPESLRQKLEAKEAKREAETR